MRRRFAFLEDHGQWFDRILAACREFALSPEPFAVGGVAETGNQLIDAVAILATRLGMDVVTCVSHFPDPSCP